MSLEASIRSGSLRITVSQNLDHSQLLPASTATDEVLFSVRIDEKPCGMPLLIGNHTLFNKAHISRSQEAFSLSLYATFSPFNSQFSAAQFMAWVELGFIAYTSGVTFAILFCPERSYMRFWTLKAHLKMYVIVLHCSLFLSLLSRSLSFF